MNTIKVYIAGPLFTEAERNQRIKEEILLKKMIKNVIIFNPLTLVNQNKNIKVKIADATYLESARIIYSLDRKAIENSNIMIADIANEDSGTMIEIGIALTLGTIDIYLVNSDFRSFEKTYTRYNKFLLGMAVNEEKIITGTNRYFYQSFDEAVITLKANLSSKTC